MKIPTIRKLPSGAYTCQLRIDGESISITDYDKKIVEAKAYAYKAGMAQKRKAPEIISVYKAIENYIDDRTNVLSPSTIREYTRSRDRDFNSIKNIKVNKITRATLQKWVNQYSSNHAAKTVANTFRLLSAALINADVDKSTLDVFLPQKQKVKTHAPTEEDIINLIKISKGSPMELPILLAAFGSLRRSEICALTKDDITDSGVNITKALVLDKNKQWVVKPPKTPESNRHAQLPPEVVKLLRTHEGYKITDLSPDAISHRFPHLLRSAGIPHFRFHDLRHYWVSVAHAMGMPDYYIMKNGGWTTMETPRKIYMNDMPELVQEKQSKTMEKFAQQMQNANKNANEF